MVVANDDDNEDTPGLGGGAACDELNEVTESVVVELTSCLMLLPLFAGNFLLFCLLTRGTLEEGGGDADGVVGNCLNSSVNGDNDGDLLTGPKFCNLVFVIVAIPFGGMESAEADDAAEEDILKPVALIVGDWARKLLLDSSSKLPLLERSPCWLEVLTLVIFASIPGIKFPRIGLDTPLVGGVFCTVNGDPNGVEDDTC